MSKAQSYIDKEKNPVMEIVGEFDAIDMLRPGSEDWLFKARVINLWSDTAVHAEYPMCLHAVFLDKYVRLHIYFVSCILFFCSLSMSYVFFSCG